MKETLMTVSDRLLLRKKAIFKTINEELKKIAQVEHPRNWCFDTSSSTPWRHWLHIAASQRTGNTSPQIC